MRAVCIILSVAVSASAQYAVTDLIGDDKGAVSSESTPHTGPAVSSESAPHTGPAVSSDSAPHTGPSFEAKHPAKSRPGTAAASTMVSILQGDGLQVGQDGALSQDSMDVVSGLVEAFMHKVKLETGERACLEKNARQVSGDIVGTVGDVVTAVKTLMKSSGTAHKNAGGSLLSAGIDSAMKITSMVTSSMQLVKNCVHGDALALLNVTAHHLINGTYLERRFIVNGVDIAHSLSDTIVAFEKHDFHRLGSDIGIALRKILLSNARNATTLPEGMPEQKIIQEATDGLMRGIFAQGSAMRITDKSQSDVDIDIDLHQCIAGNSAFFKELWLAAWNLIAQLSMNPQQHGFRTNGNNGQPKWESELMVALMEFPSALAKCGLSQDMQTMFTEAIQSIGNVSVQVKLPRDHFSVKSEAVVYAKCVEAWTNWNFEKFGFELGKVLRELLMLAFPQKYSIDASGRLWLSSKFSDLKAQKKPTASSSSMLIMGAGGAVSMLVALALVRARRIAVHVHGDIEDGSNDVLVGHDAQLE